MTTRSTNVRFRGQSGHSLNRQSAPMKRGYTKRPLQVAARKQAVAEAIAKLRKSMQTDCVMTCRAKSIICEPVCVKLLPERELITRNT
jgi:hypothetical protein